jgi:hypothetical protein
MHEPRNRFARAHDEEPMNHLHLMIDQLAHPPLVMGEPQWMREKLKKHGLRKQ